MKNTNRYRYISQFAKLCEDIYPQDLDHVMCRIMDVLPYILEAEFGHDWDDIREKVKNCLEIQAFESSVFCLIPVGLSVRFEKSDVLAFSFGSDHSPESKKIYYSSSEVFSLGLLGAYLRYLIDKTGFSLAEGDVSACRSHLGLV